MQVRRTGNIEYGRFVKLLVVGPPGTGKTKTSSTAPNVIYANADGGLMSVADKALPYTDIEVSEDLSQLRQALDLPSEERADFFGTPIDTVVIDTIDEVQRILVRERLAETRKESLQLQDWGWLGEQMQSIVRGFRNLSLNVIMCCHSKETSDEETGHLYFKPGLQGAIADQIPAFVDLSLLLRATSSVQQVDGEPQRVVQRYFQTTPDSNHPWIKDRSGKLPPEVPVNFEDDFQRLYDYVFSGIKDLPDSVDLTQRFQGLDVEDKPKSSKRTVGTTERKREPALVGAKKATPEGESNGSQQEMVTQANEVIKEATQPEDIKTEPDICEECGVPVDIDQRDISKIRFRKILCKQDFTNHKNK